MSTNPTPDVLQQALEQFVAFRRDRLSGDEKGEAQVFLDRLFQAFGHGGVFEAGATLEQRVSRRDNGGTAFADLVWRPRVLVEMKRGGRDLSRDYRQVFEYWIDLVPDRPAYVVLCNFDDFWIYDLNSQLDEPVDRVALDDLPRRWEALAFLLPRGEEPTFGNDLVAVTRESAANVSGVFNRLVQRGIDREAAQRFVLQCVMAMFSEDIGLLPRHYFTHALDDALDGASAFDLLFGLFFQMNSPGMTSGGRYVGTPYFNGGLFREIAPFELESEEVERLRHSASTDWSQVRPAIFGTLFEQSLDHDERHAYGAHFTSEADIQKIVLPTIVRPWRERVGEAQTLVELGALQDELLRFRVLDPACGCGNFLYIAYRELRRIEHDISVAAAARRRRRVHEELQISFVSADQFYGIDIRPFAIEIAKVTLMLARKLAADELGDEQRVLPLDDLDENLIAADALDRPWPEVEVIIGNPPYLGRRNIADERGAGYAAWLADAFPEVGGVSDYVSYFFRKTHDHLRPEDRAGLVGTAAIRRGDTRVASLDYITDNGGTIYDAHASQPWAGDATVQVSIVNWVKGDYDGSKTLWLGEGDFKVEVPFISGSLSAEPDLRQARLLAVNQAPKRAFQGQTPGHRDFVLTVEQASEIVERDPISAEVIYPYLIGRELQNDAQPQRFVIDIPAEDAVAAARWRGALDHLRSGVLPARQAAAEEEERENLERLRANPHAQLRRHHAGFFSRWWQQSYRRADMMAALDHLTRYIALSRVAIESRPSIYVFMSPTIRPGDALQVFAFDDDYSFGVLASRFHRRWFEERCSTMRVDLRYTSRRVFETFPWPQAPTDEIVGRVVEVVEELLAYRQERLDAGITLGGQYQSLTEPGVNHLREIHDALDEAVRVAYGFDQDEDELLQLLALNESIASEAESGITAPRGPGGAGPNSHRTSYAVEPEIRL